MAKFRRKPEVFEAAQILEDTLMSLGGERLEFIHAGEWVITFTGGEKTVIHDIIFQRDFLPQSS